MAAAREVLTLQFGAFSNFVGAHFWNAQEATFTYDEKAPVPEIFHDCLFRVGEAPSVGQTYTPRAIICENKFNLGALSARGILYADERHDAMLPPWAGALHTIRSQPEAASAYVQDRRRAELDGTELPSRAYDEREFRAWPDVQGVHLHPRSMQLCDLGPDDRAQNIFSAGAKLASERAFRDDFESRTHVFLEECDRLQGLQIFVDSTTAYGGIAASAMESFFDDHGRMTAVAFACMPSRVPADGEYKAQQLNAALTLTRLAHVGVTVAPACVGPSWQPQTPDMPGLAFQRGLPYHEGAILAAAIDTITMCARLRGSQWTLSDMVAAARGFETRIVSLGAALPLPVTADAPLSALLQGLAGKPLPLSTLTPHAARGRDDAAESHGLTVIRGVTGDLLRPSAMARAGKHEQHPLERYDTANTMLLRYLFDAGQRGHSVFTADTAFPVRPPYPALLPGRAVPMAARLEHSSAVQLGLAPLVANLSEFGTADRIAWDVASEELLELREALDHLRGAAEE